MNMRKPSVAVVVTVKNDAAALQVLLSALETQTHLPNEVVLTITDSQDKSVQVAQNWQPDNINAKVLFQDNLSRGAGRNLGVENTQVQIIVFTDAGCIPESNWLEELLKPFQDKKVKLVSGLTWVRSSNAWLEAQAPFVLVPPPKIESHPLPATRNMAIRRTVFVEHQGFNPSLNFAEDYELARRIREQGVHAEFASTAVVWWQPQSNLLGFYTMMKHLTQGDMQARTWRLGHLTIILRYLVFLLVPICLIIWISAVQASILGLATYSFYLFLKTISFSYQNWRAYFWAPLLQLTTDLAVLSGLAGFALAKKKE